MTSSSRKVKAIHDCPTPKDVTALRQFLGLASYCRHYIQNFADIAAPLTTLTEKTMPFVWSPECVEAFTILKSHVMKVSVLAYPCFSHSAIDFVVQTNGSGVGVGAVLEQDGHVIFWVSHSLTSPE